MHSCPTRFASTPSVPRRRPHDAEARPSHAGRRPTASAPRSGGRRWCRRPRRPGWERRPDPAGRRAPHHRATARPACRSAVASTVAGSGCARSSRSLSLDRASDSRVRARDTASACWTRSRRRARPDPHRSPRAPPSSVSGPSTANSSSCGPSRKASATATGTGTSAASHGIRARCCSGGAVGQRTSMSSVPGGGPAPGAIRTVPSPGWVTGGPGPAERRTRSVVEPTTTVEPASTDVTPPTRAPSTTTPLVEAQSSTLTPLGPTPTKR